MHCNNYEPTSTPDEHMKKTDLLLKMMEHPQKHTDQEWQEVLADKECRHLYTLMAKTKSAVSTDHVDELASVKAVDEAWKQFERMHYPRHIFMVYRYAAMIVGILMLTGIAYAAVHFLSMSRPQVSDEQDSLNQVAKIVSLSEIETEEEAVVTDSVLSTSPQLFDNVPLEQILETLSGYYHVDVVFQDERTRRIRLFYQWKPEFTLEKVVGMLNNFETLNVIIDGNTLVVSSKEAAGL